MDQQQFLEALITVAEKGSLRAVRRSLEKPAGRQPPQDVVETSEWYRNLSDADQTMVLRVAAQAASQTIYNILLVLDGRSAIESQEQKGTLRLQYISGAGEILLAETGTTDLSDLYKDIQSAGGSSS